MEKVQWNSTNKKQNGLIIIEKWIIRIIRIIIKILELIDSINLRHRQYPLLPPRFSQEFFNVSNFSSQLLTVQNIPTYSSHRNKHMLRYSCKKWLYINYFRQKVNSFYLIYYWTSFYIKFSTIRHVVQFTWNKLLIT